MPPFTYTAMYCCHVLIMAAADPSRETVPCQWCAGTLLRRPSATCRTPYVADILLPDGSEVSIREALACFIVCHALLVGIIVCHTLLVGMLKGRVQCRKCTPPHMFS